MALESQINQLEAVREDDGTLIMFSHSEAEYKARLDEEQMFGLFEPTADKPAFFLQKIRAVET